MIEVIDSVFSLVRGSEYFKREMRSMSTADRVEIIFREMDEDESGELSKEEFINGARKDTSVIAALSLYSRTGYYDHLNEAFTSC